MNYRQENFDIRNFCSLMEQPDCEAWMKGRQIIQRILNESATLSGEFTNQIRRSIKKINNLLMLVYIYSLNIESSYSGVFSSIRGGKNSFDTYRTIYQWVINQSNDIRQSAIELLLDNFLSFLRKLASINQSDIYFCLCIYRIFEIKRQRNLVTVINFMSNFKEIIIYSNEDKQVMTKQVMIIKQICQILSQQDKFDQGNMGMIFDQTLIGAYSQKNIQRYFQFYGGWISNMTAEQLLRIVNGLCNSSLNILIVVFISNITRVLKSEDEFFKLRYLYEKSILPNLIRKGKHCKIDGIQQTVSQVGQTYVNGFIKFCEIGKKGIECLLENIESVKSIKYKKKWIQLAYYASCKSNLTDFVDSMLQAKKIPLQMRNQCKSNIDAYSTKETWEITARNIKQHKVYQKHPSGLNGMKNKSSQCYIISTVQALLRTEMLSKLFNIIPRKKKNTAIGELSRLFQQLKSQKTEKSQDIKVDDLQQYGPKLFADSTHQEDVHQYLLALMDQLENQFKDEERHEALKKFKEIYEVEQIANVKCNDCKHQINTNQKTYIHTISNTEKLKLQSNETLTDFNCQKCKKNNIAKKTSILLKSEIFIVHINRFSIDKGVAKKELPTEKIPRSIENYELVGIIFHIGRNVQSGHYVFFWRKSTNRWVEFNDTRVREFELDKENQEFEREMKAENTPYILFYKRTR